MKTLKSSQTIKNLIAAFALEAQASTRYLLFENIAREEGLTKIADLFRETAESESSHALTHLGFIKEFGDPLSNQELGDTKQNLKASIHSESHEFTDFYPGLVKIARQEGLEEIADWLETLSKAERSHAGKFERALSELSNS